MDNVDHKIKNDIHETHTLPNPHAKENRPSAVKENDYPRGTSEPDKIKKLNDNKDTNYSPIRHNNNNDLIVLTTVIHNSLGKHDMALGATHPPENNKDVLDIGHPEVHGDGKPTHILLKTIKNASL